MTEVLPGSVNAGDDDADRVAVEQERERLREFVEGLSADDIKSGGWFTKLCAQALRTYTEKATWEYFQQKYKGVPADGIVERQIKLAAKNAMIEGGLTSSLYTGTVAATVGSLGGASAATVPAGLVTFMVDLTFITQLQMRLAHDIAVIYRIPLDVDDPEDMMKLVRVAFGIKAGEVARGSMKFVPGLVRQVLKKYYSGPVLAAAKSLPIVGKHLLQRNIIKFGIPGVGIPLTILVNRYTTVAAGRHARSVFRDEAGVIELADTLIRGTRHPRLMLWVAWLVINADGKITEAESLLFHRLTRLARERHQIDDEELANVVNIDPDEVWRRIDAEPGDLHDVVEAAERVAAADGDLNPHEKAVVDELRDRCRRR
ncbi:TerB family tellurite resistance protein [Streptomyces sp. NBC_00028]|uniref:TerB family tellurite resistance protein n=1 Tax=Streptomyces sp. NBC_00028 TaxID=2975624 RepID=UPI00324AA2DB